MIYLKTKQIIQTVKYHNKIIECPHCKNKQEDQSFNEIKKCTKCHKHFLKTIPKKLNLCDGCNKLILEKNRKIFDERIYCKRCYDEITSYNINQI